MHTDLLEAQAIADGSTTIPPERRHVQALVSLVDSLRACADARELVLQRVLRCPACQPDAQQDGAA